MDPDPAYILLATVIFVSFVTTAFFSGVEIAFISMHKQLADPDRKKENAPSVLVSYFLSKPSQFIASMVLGHTLSMVVFVLALATLLSIASGEYCPLGNISLLVLQIFIATLAAVLQFKYLPRAWFQNHSRKVLAWSAVPLILFFLPLYPVIQVVLYLIRMFIRIFWGDQYRTKRGASLFEKYHYYYVEDTHSHKLSTSGDERNLRLLNKALDFSQVKIRECIVPRTQLVAISINDSVELLRQKFADSGNSKILVYEGSIDNIIGYIHHSKLFELPVPSIKRMVKELPFVPETMSAQMLLSIFVKSNKNIAVVVDEFGGTTGIVTIEDIMEEIFGEIVDEHDRTGLVDKCLSDNEYEFSGRVEIDHINEKYGLKIETSDEFETIAGFVLHKNGSIPKLNDTITIGTMIFTVLEVSPTRIERLRLKLNGETN